MQILVLHSHIDLWPLYFQTSFMIYQESTLSFFKSLMGMVVSQLENHMDKFHELADGLETCST